MHLDMDYGDHTYQIYDNTTDNTYTVYRIEGTQKIPLGGFTLNTTDETQLLEEAELVITESQ